uniref:Uncharacterized protein n=1 Tax=viral metagenome TaxID=1070528 RepID=A0A6M3M7Y4_9ZZZZ
MRLRQISTWQTVSRKTDAAVEFVVSMSSFDRRVVFCGRSDKLMLEDDAGASVVAFPGLLTDLAGISMTMDPRQNGDSMIEVSSLSFAAEAIAEHLGDGVVPYSMGAFVVEIALVCDQLSWDDRIVFVSDVRVDPSGIEWTPDGEVSLRLMDPLATGNVLLPEDTIDISKLPAAWTADFLIDATNGVPFPIAYGDVYRAPPIRVYDDGGDGAGNDRQPIRRYILAGHVLTGANATLHRTNSMVRQLQSGVPDMSDLSKPIQVSETTDGKLFSWVQTDSGEEDPTATDPATGKNHPLEVFAISYEATNGEQATMGGVIRHIIQRWTDLEIDGEMEASLSDLVVAFAATPVSVFIDGSGADRSTVAELIDQRFRPQFPISVARYGGKLMIKSLQALFRPPGSGYYDPTVNLVLGVECHLEGSIRETGNVFNRFEIRFRRSGDEGTWDGPPVLALPDSDFECERSRATYGLKPSPTMDLEDVIDEVAVAPILDHLRFLYLDPWFEVDVICPVWMAVLVPIVKCRIWYEEEAMISDYCRRHRFNLAHDETAMWRDGFVVGATYARESIRLRVIF